MAVPFKLSLPDGLTDSEKSAVNTILLKWRYNRFQVHADSNNTVTPLSTVDLINIQDQTSLLCKCLDVIEKRFYLNDIAKITAGEKVNVNLAVLEQIEVAKGFFCFIFTDDLNTFAERFATLERYGSCLAEKEPHLPNPSELCLVLFPDDDGSPFWYRAEFQVDLENERAQVRLIDFFVTAVVPLCNIRKFEQQFAYEQLSFIGKIRAECSLELLNNQLLQRYSNVNATLLRPAGNGYEVFLDQNYFFDDGNFEEEILQAEDLLQQQQQLQLQQAIQLQQQQQNHH